MRQKLLFLLCCSVLGISLNAQTPYMVKDIRSGAIGGFEYLYTGTSYSSFNFTKVWEHNNEIFFVAVNQSNNISGVINNNYELWKSDGTTGGTVIVKDINPGVEGSYPRDFFEFAGELYFSASDGSGGRELWKTDGTTVGTVLVKEIRAGAAGGFEYLYTGTAYSSFNFIPVWTHNGEFYFVAINQSSNVSGIIKNNWELWKSNGTTAGTVLVKDIWSGTDGSDPSDFYAFNNELYFSAENGTSGRELWKTDGSSAGTVMVKEIRAGAEGGFEYLYTGTAYSSFDFNSVWTHNGEFYFIAINQSSNVSGVIKNNWELWKSNGTTAGTVLVKDIWSGTDGSDPSDFYAFNNELYFSAENGTSGRELWKTDGSSAGTVMVKEIRAGAEGGFEYLYTGTAYSSFDFNSVWTHNGEFYFIAINQSSNVSGVIKNNWELWKSNGTTAGTVLVKDIWSGTDGSDPSDFYAFNNELYFSADNGTSGRELWKTDGSTAGTVMVKEIRAGAAGGFEYLYTGTAYSSFDFIPVWSNNGSFYFIAVNQSSNVSGVIKNNWELWKSDGTTGGTTLVKDIWSGVDGSDPDDFYSIGNDLFFSADNGTQGRELWKTDGTQAGTVLVKDIRTGSNGGFEYLYASNAYSSFDFKVVGQAGSTFYFVAVNSSNASTLANNYELWKSDGTAAGTMMVMDIYTGTEGSYPGNFTSALGKLFFSATNSTNGRELWAMNGVTTAVPEQPISSFSVFPNPASGYFQIRTDASLVRDGRYEVYDVNGRLIITDDITGELVTCDISALEKGVYFVYVYGTDAAPQVKKLLVQ